MKKIAIIPSGGFGKRLKERLPKQYIKVLEKEIIAYTLETFQNSEQIDSIVIPAQKEYFELLESIKNQYNISKLIQIIEGGKERQDSVINALNSISCNSNDLIIVHDAARPLLTIDLLDSAIKYASKCDSLIVASKINDTLIRGKDEIQKYINRENVYSVQTPQIFRYSILKSSCDRAISENFYGTDESSLVERAGYKVKIYEGDSLNFKITNKNDLELFVNLVKGSFE